MLKTKTLNYIKLEHFPSDVNLNYQSDGASGVDLVASIDHDIIILPFQRELIPTGIIIELPYSREGQIRSRSGLALKHGVVVLNSPATIDNDYNGEIKVILANLGGVPFTVSRGMRIAQLVIASIDQCYVKVCEKLSHTSVRGAGGFGSTGFF